MPYQHSGLICITCTLFWVYTIWHCFEYHNFPKFSDPQSVRTPFKIMKIINFLCPKFSDVLRILKKVQEFLFPKYWTVNMTKNQDFKTDLRTVSFVFASDSCDQKGKKTHSSSCSVALWIPRNDKMVVQYGICIQRFIFIFEVWNFR